MLHVLKLSVRRYQTLRRCYREFLSDQEFDSALTKEGLNSLTAIYNVNVIIAVSRLFPPAEKTTKCLL